MTVTAAHYDDGEDVATPGDGFTAANRPILEAVRAIPDQHVRRAFMVLVVLVLFHGRVGR